MFVFGGSSEASLAWILQDDRKATSVENLDLSRHRCRLLSQKDLVKDRGKDTCQADEIFVSPGRNAIEDKDPVPSDHLLLSQLSTN